MSRQLAQESMDRGSGTGEPFDLGRVLVVVVECLVDELGLGVGRDSERPRSAARIRSLAASERETISSHDIALDSSAISSFVFCQTDSGSSGSDVPAAMSSIRRAASSTQYPQCQTRSATDHPGTTPGSVLRPSGTRATEAMSDSQDEASRLNNS